MASNIMASRPPMPFTSFSELKSVEEVTQRIQKYKRVLILFNKKYALEDDIEHKFNSWRDIYEDTYGLYVYKCVITPLKSELKTEYKITKLPTFIFFHHGKLISQLEDVEKADPNDSSSPKNAEEKLRSWLDRCCTSNE